MRNTRHWFPAYVGVGSNLKMPAKQVEGAFERLGEIADTRLVSRSSLYRSSPLGGIEQPDFVNAVAGLLTMLSARELLAALHRIEKHQGRERDMTRWGPRVLDLDLLIYGAQVLDEAGITVPHPGIAERNFVLLPLAEIAPQLVIPALGRVTGIAVNKDEPSISRIQ
ncbi:MAG: 2-amino-4-hydroxy-6-hydroxymethyldihydropteridine diphosphokinase [Gammaproteobacteria bacterium]|nr:2-amino-4-hydroxy-6-hydroxymethyldihydropteridine diphosphokinase [Gammaproteobacteria bacterium]NNF50273.1 2-amino-4-hydroxy-6-hydroxymethyldihydropteridine diphosphokinase [Woeseiaceae bacterium]MBT8095235.1 2-amino-4-hydroxy-6-hydroxymethyldihydropteridine diphosphokinase [Gammaproteobacteria bacterium]MBT8105644.1 2-amino-4-hydroxy-6-hydroxymethyldihydropteridine diphosphokinase [Gammaproteobacteria bacterium]NNK25658.1 2-amino-4-hydroxy-6-hydroxymethyldihydropteridine diphosphokinase [W